MAFKINLDIVMAAADSDEDIGFCLACGAEHAGCEPDARHYYCDVCGKNKVYGAQEILAIIVA